MRASLDRRLWLVPLLGLAACGSDPPSYARIHVDASIECTPRRIDAGPPRDAGPPPDGGRMDAGPAEPVGPERPCPEGEVCLQGRCYPGCADDLDCSTREQCDDGVCVPRTRPRPDGGADDAGPTDLCEDVMCEIPLPSCHPVTGECVECLTRDDCSTGNCDAARGVCRGNAPGACAPCTTDAQCTDGTTVFGACRMIASPYERVCVPSCAGGAACPTGLECHDDEYCYPRIGSCTGFFAAVNGRSCTSDAECEPLGAPVAEGQCQGVAMDTPGTCRQPCGLIEDCPSGYMCTDGFCVPMPMM